METKAEKNIEIRNLGQRHHIFGAVAIHPHDDPRELPVTIHPIENLAPGQSVFMSKAQFKYFDDEEMLRKLNTREFAIFVDGRDMRPHLAKKEEKKGAGLKPTESEAAQESSVLAEILAEGEPQAS